VSDPSPANDSVDISISLSKLWFSLINHEGNNMDYIVGTNPDIGSGSGTGVPKGRYNITVSNLGFNTPYVWYVNMTDGTNWTNASFNFKTELPTNFDPYQEWGYRKSITIDYTKVSANLNGFPVLIDITDEDLKAHAQSDGDDILFMDGDGIANRLPHEIESYNSGDGHLVAWVNVSSLSSAYPPQLIQLYICIMEMLIH